MPHREKSVIYRQLNALTANDDSNETGKNQVLGFYVFMTTLYKKFYIIFFICIPEDVLVKNSYLFRRCTYLDPM